MTSLDRSARSVRRARRSRRRAFVALGLALSCTAVATASPAAAEWPALLGFLNPPTTTAPSASSTARGCAGAAAPLKVDGSAWECTFFDEFGGSTLDRTKWVPQQTAYSSFTTGVECYLDDRDNVSVGSGSLRLTARREWAAFTCQDPIDGPFRTHYTAGMVSTFWKFSQAYGRFEIRAKFPASKVKGTHAALWLWPDDAFRYGLWPRSGEIDIAEVYSGQNDRAIPYVHYATDGPDLSVTNNYCLLDPAQWHTYVAEWTETSLRVLYDGKVCLDHTWNPAAPLEAPQPFDHPFMIGLTQGFGVGANAFTPGKTRLPATTYIDYVRVYR